MAIELHHEDARADNGAIVGVVRILDELLVTVTTSLVRAGAGVPVDLSPGRYFIDGWSPAGERFYGVIETADGRADVHVDRGQPTADDPGSFLDTWSFNGRGWERRSPRSDGRADAVVWIAPGGSPRVFVVPGLIGLTTTGAGVSLKPGLAATLLGYLHRGDRSSAGVVAQEALSGRCGSSFVVDVATGYYLVHTGHPDASTWTRRLVWEHPDAADAVVLEAHLMLRGGEPEAAEAFRRAAMCGLPFVGGGLRLLSAGLEAVGAEPLVRPYVLAQLDTPLTSFWGSDPAVPQRQPIPVPQIEQISANLRRKPYGWTGYVSGKPVGLSFLPQLGEMLQELQHQRRVVRDDLHLRAVVVPSERAADRFDLDIVAAFPSALTGIGVGVGENGTVRLGEFDSRDVCRIRDLRPGPWTFTLCERRPDSRLTASAVPLPVVQSAAQTLAAAGANADEVLRATTPTGTTTLVLRRDRDIGYFLEAFRPPGSELVAISVEYGNTDGGTGLRVMPYPVNEWGRRGVRMDFGDFDAAGRWQVAEELTTEDLCRISADDLVSSLTGDITPQVRDAWREIALRLPEQHRELIDRLVA
ncbi:hypothetical protein ACWEIJ_22010 [Lentzea sp. NPDC004789]